jgi:phospholipid/cholesterol/gamma-HCH transport system substrate-binding protein
MDTMGLRLRPAWWTLILITTIVAFTLVCSAFYIGSFRPYDTVTLTSDRAGLVMETGARVEMRGVEIGQVGAISGGREPVTLTLEITPKQMQYIPANVQAEIRATTAFGAKYVELVPPADPSPAHLAPGAVLRSRNVSTEVNTVFENLVGLLKQIDVAKLNSILTAIAEGIRGQGTRIGEAITGTNQVLLAVNPRMGTLDRNWRSLTGFSDAYSRAARDILATLNAAATTSTTATSHAKDLDALLLNAIGLSQAGIDLLAPNTDHLIGAINTTEPTTNLLLKYKPEFTCLLLGSKWFLDNAGYTTLGGNGYSLVVDAGLLMGKDPYQFPENLPVVAAKGGPGGTPSCGSLPDATKNFPVRQLVTNTGWGTGVDIRPNPGLGHPCWADFLPVTRGVPQPASIRACLPGPAPGPIPFPGAAPYGAPQYGPGGNPLYPGVPPPPSVTPPPP